MRNVLRVCTLGAAVVGGVGLAAPQQPSPPANPEQRLQRILLVRVAHPTDGRQQFI